MLVNRNEYAPELIYMGAIQTDTRSFKIHCAIWYHLPNLKNVKNTHGRLLLLVKLQALVRFSENKRDKESVLQG